MIRPRVDDILRPLKPFQRRTVDHAFQRLFLAENSSSRFLVADEVGLGKTLVARGIIARAIDHLWDDVKRIDIVYICSNGALPAPTCPSSGSVAPMSVPLRWRPASRCSRPSWRRGTTAPACSTES